MMEALKNLIRRVPGRYWLVVGGLLAAAFWMQQHDARIRQQAGLQQLRSETSAEVAGLRKQAAHDVEQANVENAKAVAELEQRRQQAEQQSRQLAAQLAGLRNQAQVQAGEVATLPISEIVTRVAAQLGLKAEDVASNGQHGKSPLTRPRQAGPPSPLGEGLATHSSAPPPDCHPEERQATKDPGSSIAASGQAPCKEQTAGILRSAQDDRAAALSLTASGARKVETALVALDACRAESSIQGRQFSNCQVRAEADEAAIGRLNGSVVSLNQALAAKDKVLAGQQAEYKAELRAARGTFLGRLARLTEHVAIGVGLGVAIGVAVK
ncbi:MAG: hypothetical protein EPN47_19355 [Acidobacteria bacterium]|nr:MAG: hypothetical protein EPN47_19355 [Acidobacteriota bacterium]